MKKLSIIFMGAPEFALPALQAVVDAGHDVRAVYTQPPRPAGRGQKEQKTAVHQLAESMSIPVHTPTSLKSTDVQQQLADYNADVMVVAAYGLLLPKAVLDIAPMGCVNIHPSLLPRWRGAAPIQWPIIAGDTQTGMCIMQMDEGLDTGDVLMRETIPLPADATAGEMHDKLAALGADMLLVTLQGLQQGNITPQPQSEISVTYARKIIKADGEIDWTQSATDIECIIRGLNPWPIAYAELYGERIKIYEAKVVDGSGNAGEVIEGLTIACGEDALRITRAQRAGKKPMSADELLRGLQS